MKLQILTKPGQPSISDECIEACSEIGERRGQQMQRMPKIS